MSETVVRPSISQEKVWKKYYPAEARELTIPEHTLYSYLKELNKDRMDGVAINYYGAKIRYGELIDSIDETANAFAALGVKAGDQVSFLSVAIPECIAAIYAVNKLGATANMIDPRLDKESICKMIQLSGSKVLIVIDVAFPKVAPNIKEIAQDHILVQSATRSLPLIKKVAKTIITRTDVAYSDTVIRWNDFLKMGEGVVAEEVPYVGDATAAIAHTGGTTGFPKGVMLTNDSMNAVSLNFQYAGLDAHPGDKFLGIIPVFTSYGIVCGMHMPLTMGFELVPIPKFVPTTIGKLVKQFRPNHMISTPAFYELLMDSRETRNMDLSFLITMGSGGDTMNEGLEGRLKQFMKTHNIKYPLAQGYGMSEVSAAASFCVNEIFKSASVGIPSVMTTISIFDPETGEELGYGETGEICITGPTLMKGYYNRPDETANTLRLHDDGQLWVHSGDVGYMDEDGFLFILGRIKRMICRFDGHKVFPVTIESMVSEHTGVRNSCVIGVNDRGHGQGQYPLILVMFYDDTDKAAACKEIYEDVYARCEERGKPVALLAVGEIPLTGSLKNDSVRLGKEYETFDYTAWDIDSYIKTL